MCKKKLGKNYFTLIPSTYYSKWSTMTFNDGFPLVAKVGTAHAGYGKMKIHNQSEFEDFRSVVALQDRYVTCEPFIDWDFDFRIQKIGNHYRAFRRYSDNWKGKSLNQTDEDIEVTPKLKQWIDEAALALGMDICALDGVHSKIDDKEYILELNDSAIGFVERHREEDLIHTVELVLEKMELHFSKKQIPELISNQTEGGLGNAVVVKDNIIDANKTMFNALKKEEKKIEKKELKQSIKKEKSSKYWYFYFIFGILIGILSMIIVQKNKLI